VTTAEQIDKRLADLEATVFGVRGTGGLLDQLTGLRRDFRAWREEDSEKRVASQRAAVIALGSACCALLAVIATLIGVIVK
jgi:hypothetical protein